MKIVCRTDGQTCWEVRKVTRWRQVQTNGQGVQEGKVIVTALAHMPVLEK